MSLRFSFTEKDHQDYEKRVSRYAIDNHPLRDPKEDLFDTMASDEADLKKHGFISTTVLQLLRE